MKELLDWYRYETMDMHSVEVAAVLHHRFVLIHPFDDGNGRKERVDDSVIPLIKVLELIFKDFDGFFESNKLSILFGKGNQKSFDYVVLLSEWKNFLYNKTHVFDLDIEIKIELHDYYYRPILNGTTIVIPAKKYTESIQENEIKTTVYQ